MAKKLQLSIPVPCHENWDQMNPVEKGRFCNSCQKQVVDFSNMSDRQIAEFFKKPSTGSVCGRFMQDQLDRDIAIPKKRIPWVKYFFQFVIPAFLVSLKATAQKLNAIPQSIVALKDAPKMVSPDVLTVKQSTSIGEKDTLPKEECIRPTMGIIAMPYEERTFITGTVKGEDGNPIANASIFFKGARNGTAANNSGSFKLSIPQKGTVSIVVSAVGYESLVVDIKRERIYEDLNIVLKKKEVVLKEVVVAGPMGMIRCTRVGKVSFIKKDERLPQLPALPTTRKSAFEIFPNPVNPGTNIQLKWKESVKGSHTIEMFDIAGQLIFSITLNILEKTGSSSLFIPFVTAGTYNLKIMSRETGRIYSEKIVVQ